MPCWLHSRETREGRAAYGFSAKNELAIERSYLSDLRGQYYETFFVSMKDRIVSYHYDHQPLRDPINCSQLIFAGTRVVCFQLWAVKGWKSVGHRATKRKAVPWTEVCKEEDEPSQRLSGELRYLDDGRVEMWTQWPRKRSLEPGFRGTPAENPFFRSGN